MVACVIGLLLSGAVAHGAIEHIRYKGEFLAEPTASVELEVRTRDGRPRRAEFVARNFTIFCDYEPFVYERFEMRVRFWGPRFFQGDRWEINELGGRSFDEVQGWLKNRRRQATGSLLLFSNPATDVPECNSGIGRGRWKAIRLG